MKPATQPKKRIELLITDLDNTLWDWFHAWNRSFSAMLDRLSEMSGLPVDQLKAEIRAVHRRRGTTEYSYLLNELPALRKQTRGRDPSEVYDDAVHRLNSARVRHTKLYPGAREALSTIQAAGVPIVAYSESLAYWTEWRIRRTGLDGVIVDLYTSPDHDFPDGVKASELRTLPESAYGLRLTRHHHVPRGVLKPDPRILQQVLTDYSVDPSEAVYVGDSLFKDVAMAQAVGVVDVHAAYGVAYDRSEYDLLREVSHWSDDDIRRERELASHPFVSPTYTLRSSFSELLDLFHFLGGTRE